MSVIKLPLLFVGSKGEQTLYTLFDSGANLSCIHPDHIDSIANKDKLPSSRYITTASEGHRIEVTYVARLEFYINEVMVSDEFLVVPGLTEEAVIGAVTMQKWRMKLDFDHDTVYVDPKVMIMQLI
ncbi:MAG: hypothetical protein U1C70_00005 [Sediminibacterium sp.]|jgi:hypothetical protein|uniref:hypothetical protein n=1 Tax=Sediminibacterium sp. TaxID=1917865 RepID=UPI002ABCDC7A|nr:hypothetical protein [Sediminibacterium sp.]MDZ4070177.1 hypothetical protein [Sediminibacterium sp.]